MSDAERRRMGARSQRPGRPCCLPSASLQSAGAAPVAAAPAAAAPGPYSASAHGDIVDLDVDLLGGDLAGVKVGHSEVVADTAATPRVVASSKNAELSLGGSSFPIDEQVATAPPSMDPPERRCCP